MATTNKSIIDAYKTAHGIPFDTPLYTYAAWYNMGYRVRKGEKYGQERTVDRCFVKTANLFEMSQVERMV